MWRRRKFQIVIGQLLAQIIASGGIFTITHLQPAHAQTLDEAVKRQLINGCEILLNDQDPSEALDGTLRQICPASPMPEPCPDLPMPELPAFGCNPGAPPLSANSAGGGAAATPARLPGIIERRMRGAHAKDSASTSGAAASADAVSTFSSDLSVYVSGQFMSLNKAVTASEDGYDSELRRITTGIDYNFTHNFNAGLGLDSYQHEGNLIEAGKFDDESIGLFAYGMLSPRDDLFVQFLAGYARNNYQRERFATLEDDNYDAIITGGTINGKFNSNQFRLGGLGGYDFVFSQVTVGMRIGLDWSLTKFSHLVEKGTRTQGEISFQGSNSTGIELQFYENERTSLQTTMGFTTHTAFPISSIGNFVPHVSVDWKHEFEQDQRNIEVSFVEDRRDTIFSYETEKPDRDWFEFGAGLNLTLQNGLRLFGNYRTMLGHSLFTSYTAILGLRAVF